MPEHKELSFLAMLYVLLMFRAQNTENITEKDIGKIYLCDPRLLKHMSSKILNISIYKLVRQKTENKRQFGM